MAIRLNPYLNFRGSTREAMTFYQSIFGGEIAMNSFAEFGMEVPEDEKEHIMHAQLSGGAIEFMAADVPSSMPFDGGNGISMSLFGDDDAQLTRFYEQLADGGQAPWPLNEAPWGDKFGMCVDRFGVQWMVNISPPPGG